MARAAAEAIQNRVSISFSCLCLAAACAIIEKNRAQYAPKTGGSRYGKIKLEVAGVPAVLYGKRSRKVYLYVHGKTAARPRQPALPAQPARQAGRCWLSICRSTAPEKQPGKLVPWVVTRELQAVYARMHPVWKHIRVYGVSIGAWFAMQALQTQNRRRRCWCPRSWIWKN